MNNARAFKSGGALTNWNTIPSSIDIPETLGGVYYYYVRSSVDELETVYYEIEIIIHVSDYTPLFNRVSFRLFYTYF